MTEQTPQDFGLVPQPGGKLDVMGEFKPLQMALLTVSDSRTRENDTSGDLLAKRIEDAGHVLAKREILRDDISDVRKFGTDVIDDLRIDVLITTGGTGLTGRDITPEALSPLFEKTIEGFSTIWHLVSFQSVGLSTLQSRACAGLANGTLIFCLPGSNGACKDGWDKIIRWQLDNRHRPCNMVELIPRFLEGQD